ncbi:MAG: hypothetical protein OXG84_10195 [Chloroflexi bacterium]|nr:hypothetical protein [Chloroflexota bacterium]
MADDIKLTRHQIQARTVGKSFERGALLYENGAISSPTRRGDEISARCQGSYPQPYRVWARFIDAEIVAAVCSCEYDWGGDCKHIVALLLAYSDQPEQFEKRATLRDELMSREKTELLDIIEEMIARYPDLEDIVERAAVDGFPGQFIDLQAIRRELRRALRISGEWMDRAAENKVYELASLGDRYALRGDYVQSIAIYCAILDECNASGYPTDDEGQYIEAVNQAVARLKEALSHLDIEQHEDLRQRLLDLLVSAVIWDIDFGGIGYADDADEIILEIVKPADTPRIRERIRLAEEKDREREYFSNWSGEAYEYFLMALDKIDSTDPEETLKRLQAKELHYSQASALLELKRYEEAAGVVAKLHPAYELQRGLELLADHQQNRRAIQLAEAALESDYDSRLAAWLIDLHKKHGDEKAEFRWQLNRMRKDPHIDNYIGLRDAAEAVGAWRSNRSEVISELKRKEAYEVLAQVYLHDEEWDLAWDTLGKAPMRQDHHPSHVIYRLDFTVAEKSRHVRPARAVPVYVNYARAEIDLRTRKDYAYAAELLREVRGMHQQLNDSAGWKTLIANLRREFARLPALQDELDKAGL